MKWNFKSRIIDSKNLDNNWEQQGFKDYQQVIWLSYSTEDVYTNIFALHTNKLYTFVLQQEYLILSKLPFLCFQ